MANSRIGAQNMYDEPVVSGTRKGKYSKTDEDESLIGVGSHWTNLYIKINYSKGL